MLMKKVPNAKTDRKNHPEKSPVKPSYYLLMLAYLVVPVYLPSFSTHDTNGPKFLAVAILNLMALAVFLYDKDFKRRSGVHNGFFRNGIGLAYALFLLFNLLSFAKAINLSESVITFSKYLTVFSAAYALYLIFSSHRTYLIHAALILTFLLLADVLAVFYYTIEYMGNKISSIYEFKSVYSNKNIFSASIFIKLPAALWLLLYAGDWKKKLGWVVLLAGVIALLILSSRAFYLGLALLLVVLTVYLIYRHFVVKKNFSLKKVVVYAGIIVGAVLAFLVIQKFLFPDNQDMYNKGLVERFTSARGADAAPNGRINNWKRSVTMIGENPLLGVGTGNWKVQVLKYESPSTDNFMVSYKNHNDFLETTAESGMPGGLMYLGIFALILFWFVKTALDRQAGEEKLSALFLPAFGLLAYSVDALFNFPVDRPEIQSLFAVYVAMAVAFTGVTFPEKTAAGAQHSPVHRKPALNVVRLISAGAVMLFAATVLIFAMYSKSLYYQKLIAVDERNNKYSNPASYYQTNLPDIPDLGCMGTPLKTYVARYLLNENKNREAINLLYSNKTSPFDGRREVYLSMAYDKLGMADSVIYWSEKAIELKPLFFPMVVALSNKLFLTGNLDKATAVTDNYLGRVKSNPEAWILSMNQHLALGDITGVLQRIDSVHKYLPANAKIDFQVESMTRLSKYPEYIVRFARAKLMVESGQYAEGVKLVNEFISQVPDFRDAYQLRAISYLSLGRHQECLADIAAAFSLGNDNEAFLINLRGSALMSSGKGEAACQDFKKAMEMGSADAAANYKQFCR